MGTIHIKIFDALRSGAVLGGFLGFPETPPSQNFLLIVHKTFLKSMNGKNLLLPSKIAVKLEEHWLW